MLSCSSPGWLSVCRSPAAPLGAGPTQWDDVARPWHPSSPLPFFIRGRLSDSGTRLISCAEEILPSHKPGAGSIQLGVRAVVLMGNTHRVSAMHASGEHSTIGWLPASWLPEYMDSALPFLQLRSLTQADLGGQIPAQSHRMGASVTGRSWQKQQGSCWGGRSSCDSPYCAVTLSPAPMPHHHKACWGGGRQRRDLPPLAPGKRKSCYCVWNVHIRSCAKLGKGGLERRPCWL